MLNESALNVFLTILVIPRGDASFTRNRLFDIMINWMFKNGGGKFSSDFILHLCEVIYKLFKTIDC